MSDEHEPTRLEKLFAGSTPGRTVGVLIALAIVTIAWLAGLFFLAKDVLHWVT